GHQRCAQDIFALHRTVRQEVGNGDVHGGGDHRRRIEHVYGDQLVAIHDALDHILHAGAADDEHFAFATGLTHGFDNAHGNVVVLCPDAVNVGEAREEVLHDFKAVIAVPVGELVVEHVDARAFDAGHEGVETLGVDHGRNAAQDDDIIAFTQTGLEVLGRGGAQFGVVTGHIDVLDGGIRQTAVNHGDEGTGRLGLT